MGITMELLEYILNMHSYINAHSNRAGLAGLLLARAQATVRARRLRLKAARRLKKRLAEERFELAIRDFSGEDSGW